MSNARHGVFTGEWHEEPVAGGFVGCFGYHGSAIGTGRGHVGADRSEGSSTVGREGISNDIGKPTRRDAGNAGV